MAGMIFRISLGVLMAFVMVMAKDGSKSKPSAKSSGKSSSSIKSDKPAPAAMAVDEPAPAAEPTPASESKAWQRKHSRGLTEEQKAAFRDRKAKMESLIAVIQAKRKAMRDAKPEERAAIARELHTLMLENAGDQGNTGVTARVKPDDASAPAAAEKDAEKKNELQRRTQEKREEELRKQRERVKQMSGAAPDGDD